MALNLFQDNSLTNWQQKLRKMWETYIHIPMHPDALKVYYCYNLFSNIYATLHR